MLRAPSRLALSIAVGFGLSMLVLFLWSGGGFTKVGLIEEWHIYWWRSTGGSLIPHPNAAQRLRTLARVPHEVAWMITPGLFVGLNLVHATLFLLKGLFAFMLIREVAPSRQFLAVLTGALYVVWPADTGLFAARAITQHFAIAALILGAVLLVRFARTGSLLAGFGMTAAVGAAVLSHEVTLPLALVAPALILRPALGRRVWLRLLLWYPMPLIAAGRLVYELTLRTGSYQRGKLTPVGVTDVATALASSVVTLFVSPWQEFWHGAPSFDLAIAAVAALPIVLLALFAIRGSPAQGSGEPGPARLVLTGLVIVAAGMVPHLATTMRGTRYTTLFASSLGAAICLAMVCDLLHRRIRWRAVVGAGALILLAAPLVVGRQQHEAYIRWSRLQQRILLDIVQQSGGGFVPDTVVLLIGEASGVPPPGWHFDDRYPFYPPIAFLDSLKYTLGETSIVARLCYPNHHPREASRWWSHYCELGPRSVRILTGALRPVEVPYERVVAFRYDARAQSAVLARELLPRWLADPSSAVVEYAPERRCRYSLRVSSRARRIFLDPAPPRHVSRQPPRRDVLIDFDVMPPGRGWQIMPGARVRKAEAFRPAPNPGRRVPNGWVGHPAQAWTRSTRAMLFLPLAPLGDLEIELRITQARPDRILDRLQLEIDGHPAQLVRARHPSGGFVLHAKVAGASRSGRDETVMVLVSGASPRNDAITARTNGGEPGVRVDWVHAFVSDEATDSASRR